MSVVLRTVLAVVLVLGLSFCQHRIQPIQNVTDNPIPRQMQSLPLDAIEQQIVLGGNSPPWTLVRVAPGVISGNLSFRSHAAKVDVLVTNQSYSIRYVSSTNLAEQGEEIHRNYNRAVESLRRNIDNHLIRYATGVSG